MPESPESKPGFVSAAEFRTEAGRRRGVSDPEAYVPVLVPRQDRRLRALPKKRRRAFETHLRTTLAEAWDAELEWRAAHPAAAELADATPEPDCNDLGDLPLGALQWWELQGNGAEFAQQVGRVCATCRGFCCAEGGNHAFLDVPTLRRFLRRHPGISQDEVVAHFLAKLPERSTENACVYQSATGCTLDRIERARICNSFECMGLRSLRRHWKSGGAADRLFVVARNETIKSGTFLDEDGARPCRPPRAPRDLDT